MLFYWWIHTLERASSVYLLEEFASKVSQRRTACSLEGIHIANDHRHMNELLVS